MNEIIFTLIDTLKMQLGKKKGITVLEDIHYKYKKVNETVLFSLTIVYNEILLNQTSIFPFTSFNKTCRKQDNMSSYKAINYTAME